MLKIKLTGHDYRYEVFQIVSLFYDKSDFEFTAEGLFDGESLLNHEDSTVEFRAFTAENRIVEKINIDLNDKKSIKNGIKLTALRALEKLKNLAMPWGILVGIRPTKIIHECFKKGMNDSEAFDYLVKHYDVGENKASLTLEVAKNEQRFLDKKSNSVGMYIGIPFCPTRCVYCSFTSNPIGGSGKLVDEYLMALKREIRETAAHIKGSGLEVDTLYIGGGTPTSLNASQLRELLEVVGDAVNIGSVREYTIEAGRPDSIDEEKLEIIRNSGCTRISINPQTMNDETLKRIGRLHSSQGIIDKFHLARKLGFDNINMDIIIGLPGEGEDHVLRTMKILRELSPDSITIHTMAIKRASKLNEEEYDKFNGNAEAMYNAAVSNALDMGMYPYYMYRQKNMVSPLENVGYCKKDKECIYNIQMIAENISIFAMGADAVSKIVFEEENRIERVANLKDVREYINRIDEIINNKIEAVNMLTKA